MGSVVITVLHTNMCDVIPLRARFTVGYKVVAPSDCVQALAGEEHRFGLDYLEGPHL